MAGCLIVILWLIAANDKGKEDGVSYKARGCVEAYYDRIKYSDLEIDVYNRRNISAYELLTAFGIAIGALYIGTGVLGLFVDKKELAMVVSFVL